MGGIAVETDTGEVFEGARYFETSDSKWLLELLTDAPTLPICAEVLHVDVSPLQKIVIGWWTPTDASQTWEAYEESAWQPPQTLITCIRSLITALDTTPDVYEQLEQARQNRGIEFLNLSGFTDEEFTEGGLQEELRSLLHVVILAQQRHAQMVRLRGE